jgi:hypothetical protein
MFLAHISHKDVWLKYCEIRETKLERHPRLIGFGIKICGQKTHKLLKYGLLTDPETSLG